MRKFAGAAKKHSRQSNGLDYRRDLTVDQTRVNAASAAKLPVPPRQTLRLSPPDSHLF
jgi:hypothetical protein